MKTILSILILAIALPVFSQNIPQEINTIINPSTTNAPNVLLQELLNSNEQTLQSQLEPYVFFEGQSYAVEGAIQLSKVKRMLLRDTPPAMIPYWKVKGSTQIIIILSGLGLWDHIYGYILINKESNLIDNIVFGHRAETPGLGAEIAERTFEERFIGKTFSPVHTFIVMKSRSENKSPDNNIHRVQGISGATITGDGVSKMFKKAVKNYTPLLESL